MGFWSRMRGGGRAATRPDLAALQALRPAADTLILSFGYRPTGLAAVCFRDTGGDPAAGPQAGAQAVLRSEAAIDVERMTDDYGFTWLTLFQQAALFPTLVEELRAVSDALDQAGFGDALLCALVVFEDAERNRLGLVYLHDRGTLYPFVPSGPQQRDNALELQIRAAMPDDVPMEPELARWGALFSAPGLG